MSSKKTVDDYVIDPSRRKAVKAGPEERVRQSAISFLHDEIGVPLGLISVEKRLEQADTEYRADLVVHTRDGKPWMIIECKAPSVKLTQAAFDQVGRYNRLIQARYLLITNGEDHYCCSWDVQQKKIAYLDEFPSYPNP
ncbi:MAG: type I restriction enzyme HsdR N-terminal domain-containing protein [Rhodothermia bacterium]|nr:MAG: type I restriction enzyme HsdR N-terminal domain-containing protein [Rhodothermia bacterium]